MMVDLLDFLVLTGHRRVWMRTFNAIQAHLTKALRLRRGLQIGSWKYKNAVLTSSETRISSAIRSLSIDTEAAARVRAFSRTSAGNVTPPSAPLGENSCRHV